MAVYVGVALIIVGNAPQAQELGPNGPCSYIVDIWEPKWLFNLEP